MSWYTKEVLPPEADAEVRQRIEIRDYVAGDPLRTCLRAEAWQGISGTWTIRGTEGETEVAPTLPGWFTELLAKSQRRIATAGQLVTWCTEVGVTCNLHDADHEHRRVYQHLVGPNGVERWAVWDCAGGEWRVRDEESSFGMSGGSYPGELIRTLSRAFGLS